jgi:hypothetical protein
VVELRHRAVAAHERFEHVHDGIGSEAMALCQLCNRAFFGFR